MHIRKTSRWQAPDFASLFAVTSMAAVMLTTLATADAATPKGKPKPRRGGKVIVALNLESPSLNPYLGTGNAPVSNQILASAYHVVGKEGRSVPDLIVGDPKITTTPFSLTYTIKKKARWSDGTPITARDFVFTWQVLARSTFKIPDETREQYEPIAHAKILGPKRVRFVFRNPVLEWKDLFAPVLPQHALTGEDFDKVWRDQIDNPKTGRPISSGPFIFESWSRGSRLTLARNDEYWGKKAHLDRLVFRFLLPEFGAQGDPALKKPFVRQAIAHAIDRRSLTSQLFREIAPGLKTGQSAVYLPFQRGYRPHWNLWTYSPQKAIRLLRSHDCRTGSDGIFSCQGRRLSFRFASTAGSVLRERTFDLIEPELRRVGIDLVKAFSPRQLFFDTLLPQGDWDLALFAWFYGLDPAGVGLENIWGCKGSNNVTGYCNHKVTTLLRTASAQRKASLRARLLNRADALMARDLPTLPLFVRPGYVIYNSRIRNVKWNPIDALWNAQDWWIAPR